MGMRWVRWGIVGIGVAILAVQLFVVLTKQDGDFILHWGWGERLRTGQFLYNGGHLPYPPAWAVPHAPLSLLPIHFAKATFLCIGIASLGMLLWVLNKLTSASMPLRDGLLFWVARPRC